MARAYPNLGDEATLDLADFGADSTVSLRQGEEVQIGEYVVPPQQVYRWGYGIAEHEATIGEIEASIVDGSGNVIPGQLRIVQEDANGDMRRVPKKFASTKVDAEPQAVTEQAQYPWVGQNSTLKLLFVARESGQTFDPTHANAKLFVSTTVSRPEKV